MTAPFGILVSCLARAFVKSLGGTIPMGWLVAGIADFLKECSDRRARREELAGVIEASVERMREAATEAIRAAGGDPGAVEAAPFVTYVTQMPGVIGRSIRRAEDPTGRTLSATLALDTPHDIARLLPQGLPHFKPRDLPHRYSDLELVDLLGVGGFGEVWKAMNPRMPSAAPVALKFCLDDEAVRSLHNESELLDRVMAGAREPGIVRLLQTHLNAPTPFLEYEFVDGGDLGALIREYPDGMDVAWAARATQILARIIASVHRLSPPIIHRDLKPANVLVEYDAADEMIFRITDFGIGDVASRREMDATMNGVTRDGATVPTSGYSALYASRQQMDGAPPAPQDDVHALGVIWYQMLKGDLRAGAPAGDGWKKKLAAKGMGQEMIALLASCMEDEREDRPQDGAALAKAIEGILPPPHDAPPPESLKCRGKGAEAQGRLTPEGFVVFAGSTAVLKAAPSAGANILASRERLVADGTLCERNGFFAFTRDQIFPTPSGAAGVVLGRNANGRIEWRAGDGRTLSDLHRQAI